VSLARTALLAALALPPAAAADAPSPIRFVETAAAWGIAFRHTHGGSGEFFMPETMGGGGVLFDFDGDGDLDLFLIDSGALPGFTGEATGSRLFRNEGEGAEPRFVDVTARSGLVVTAYGMGGAAADVDGDGFVDLYVTAFGANQLFRNRGDGTFEDVSAAAGVGDPLWGASAVFADLDGDDFLDLYVTNYVDFSFENNPLCGDAARGLRSYCHPDQYDGLTDRVFRNLGGFRFEDVTHAWGFGGADGKGLGVVASDLDGDGRIDLYVANDMTPNFLFHNLGGGRFEEIALLSGTALGPRGTPEAGMGVDAGDFDGSGRFSLVVTHLDLQTNALYCNRGGLLFVDCRDPAGIADPSHYLVGFGVAFADFDRDGELDLVVANGHIIHNAEGFGTGTTYKQRNHVLRNVGGGRFVELSGIGLDAVRASRGLAVGDLSGDGALDLVIVNSNDEVEAYANRTPAPGRYLRVDLLAVSPNPAAIGARVELEAGGRRQVREVRTGASYLSQSETTLHFGLGDAARVDRLRVRWTDGRVSELRDLPADRRVRLYGSSRVSQVSR
jgi:enediyne biosynthesis protein E4